MDGSRFDTLTRTLSAPGSRRHALGGLLASALALVSGDEAEEVTAHDALKKCKKLDDKDKKTKCLKKAKKHNATHTTPLPPPVCPPERVCASGCCPAGQVCDPQQRCCAQDPSAFCTMLDVQCGEWPGPCGRPINCGACPPGSLCRDGGCLLCANVGEACGSDANGLTCCSGNCGYSPTGSGCRRAPCSPTGGGCLNTLDCCTGYCGITKSCQ